MKLLGDILVGAKAITPALRDKALAQRSKLKGRMGTALLEVGGVPEALLLRALSVQRQVPPASADDLHAIRPDILRLVPSKLAAKLNVIPFKRVGRNVFLAMRDPQDLPAVDEISFLTGLPITPHVALEARLYQSLFEHYGIETQPRYLELAKRLDAMREETKKPETAAPAPPPVLPPPPPIFERRAAESARGPGRRVGEESGVHAFTEPAHDPWGSSAEIPVVEESAILTDTFNEPPAAPRPAAPAPPPPPPAQRIVPPAAITAPFAVVRESAPPPAPIEPPAPPAPPPVAPTAPAPVAAAPAPPPAPAPQIDDEALAAAASTGVIPRHVVAAAVAATTSASATAEEQAEEPEAPAGPDASDLVGRLSHAESRDEIAEAVLDAALQHVRRAALFIAQKDRVLGWAAKPEPPEGLRSFSLPFTEPSVFAQLRNTEGFYVGPCPELSGNVKTLAAIGAKGPSMILVVPVTLKGKSVLFIFGEAPGDGAVPPVPPMKRLAAMTATALEIVLMKNRLRNL